VSTTSPPRNTWRLARESRTRDRVRYSARKARAKRSSIQPENSTPPRDRREGKGPRHGSMNAPKS
jgi:hypothetical protein